MKKRVEISFWMYVFYNSMFILNLGLLILTLILFSRHQYLKNEYFKSAKHTGALFAIDCKNEETQRSVFRKQIHYYSRLSWFSRLAIDASAHRSYALCCLVAFEKKIKQLKIDENGGRPEGTESSQVHIRENIDNGEPIR